MKRLFYICLIVVFAVCIGCGSSPEVKERDTVSRDEIKARSDSATRELDSVVK